jgi:hypothetical protein
VARAQKALPNKTMGISGGVDTDTLMTVIDRYDDCHFSGTGQEKFANAWFKALRP